MENWLPVRGYDGAYEVSDHGRVRSLRRIVRGCNGKDSITPGRFLKLTPRRKDGYVEVQLCKDSVITHVYVHRLVAEHFIANADVKPDINHLDRNRSNNVASNLEWVTEKQNTQHSVRAGAFHAATNPKMARKLSAPDVFSVRTMRANGARARDICKRFNISECTAYRIFNGILWPMPPTARPVPQQDS